MFPNFEEVEVLESMYRIEHDGGRDEGFRVFVEDSASLRVWLKNSPVVGMTKSSRRQLAGLVPSRLPGKREIGGRN